MEYDVKVHLGQQIEYMLNAYVEANGEVLDRTKNNLLDLFQNGGMEFINKIIENHDKTKKTETENLWTKAYMDLKQAINNSKHEQVFIQIEGIKNVLLQELNELEKEYWTGIRKSILKNLNHETR